MIERYKELGYAIIAQQVKDFIAKKYTETNRQNFEIFCYSSKWFDLMGVNRDYVYFKALERKEYKEWLKHQQNT